MKFTSRFARVVGVSSLAVLLVTGLAACDTPVGMNEDYLVLANVEAVDCSAVSAPEIVAEEMQETADFVANASSKEEEDILALNEGLESLDPLTAALNAQATACGGAVVPASLAGDGATDPDSNDPITLSPELKALLDAANAPLDQYSCEKIVADTGGTVVDGTYTLFVNTLLAVDEGNLDLRQWSDALSTVLKGSTPEEMRTWLNRAICEEPVIGVSLAHLFAHLKVGDVSVLSLQSTNWLKPFAVEASEINDLVAQYTPLTVWRLQNLGKQDIPEDVYLAALKANHEYQELASRLVFLLSRYELARVMSIDSTHHYHLVAGGLTADNIPEVEISNEVDSRPALVFYLTEKTACKPISVLGFNTGDKRPMLGSIPESCETLVPPVNPPPVSPPKDNPPTDNPPPPPNPCPPGNEIPSCAPKSDDKKDYPYPKDKPAVPPVTDPPSDPAPVETERPGGGDVVDTPSNPPGSETGVDAPEATPPPASPAPPPPNEGGDNEEGDPGGF